MRLALYWSYATRALARGGQRSLLAVFCVATGVLAIVALQLVSISVSGALTGNIRALNGGDLAVHIENGSITASQLAVFDHLKVQHAISAYTPVSVAGVSQGSVRYSVFAVDPSAYPLAGAPHVLTPTTGTLATLLTGNMVVVTANLLQSLGGRVGKAVTFTTDDGRKAHVVIGGVIANTGLFMQPMMLMALPSYAALPSPSGSPVGFTWVYVNVPGHSEARATVVARTISAQLPLVDTTTPQQALRQNSAEVRNIRYASQVISLLALLIGGIGIINTMQVLLHRRHLDIALLKTIGYRSRDLYGIFGLEVGGIGLIGGLLGAAAGVGASVIVKDLVERAFYLTLPTTIDPLVVGSGIVIGVFTSLIFGLLPIVQASHVRPLAVLRGAPGFAGARRGGALSALLGALVAFLFFVLAVGILRSVSIAFIAVGGAGLLLVLLGLVFRGVAWGIGAFPVPEFVSAWSMVLTGLGLLVAAALIIVAPGFGLVALVAVALGGVALLGPRSWRATTRLALRHIGRQKGRSATTLLALCIGVFAVGLGLAITQNVQSLLDVFSQSTSYNALVFVGAHGKPAVDRQLAHLPGLTRRTVNIAAPALLLAVNGVPLPQLLNLTPAALAGGAGSGLDSASTGVEGYDVAHNRLPDVTIVKGLQDRHAGHNLRRGDAGTTRALLPLVDAQTPLKLKLGDDISVGTLDGAATVTLHVVGFYTSTGFSLAPILTDTRMVIALSGTHMYYAYALNLDPVLLESALQQVHATVPSAITLNQAAVFQAVSSILSNITVLLEALAALVMVAALVMIANAVALAMLERRRDVGILKAIGYTSRGILSGVVLEMGVIGVTSAILALFPLTLIISLLGKLVFKATFGIAPLLVLGLIVGTAALCMLVAGGVAWTATRVSPLKALRYE